MIIKKLKFNKSEMFHWCTVLPIFWVYLVIEYKTITAMDVTCCFQFNTMDHYKRKGKVYLWYLIIYIIYYFKI